MQVMFLKQDCDVRFYALDCDIKVYGGVWRWKVCWNSIKEWYKWSEAKLAQAWLKPWLGTILDRAIWGPK